MNQLVLSEKFQKDLKTLHLAQQNLYHPSLRLHKLEGQDFYSISIDMKLRIILNQEGNKLYLLRIGSHDIYKH